MELVIEGMDESGPMGLPAISVCHYGEQNGDPMRDPEMCFELGMAEAHTLTRGIGGTITGVSSSGAAILFAAIMSILSPCMSSTSALPKRGTTTCVCEGTAEFSRTSAFEASPLSPGSGLCLACAAPCRHPQPLERS